MKPLTKKIIIIIIDGEVRSEEGQEPMAEHDTKLIKTRPQE